MSSVPLIAKPTSPGNVVPVSEVSWPGGYTECISGIISRSSSSNFWIVAEIMDGRSAHNRVSLDLNPTSRQISRNLGINGAPSGKLVTAATRLHQS
ncbi:MAG: hypothetical protein U5L96_11175 [Owenweeksia sp.]|nr:hypothetical protein [Owenweeksia sp.]